METIREKIKMLNQTIQDFEFDPKNPWNLFWYDLPRRIEKLQDFIEANKLIFKDVLAIQNVDYSLIDLLNDDIARLRSLEKSNDQQRRKWCKTIQERCDRITNNFFYYGFCLKVDLDVFTD